MAKELLKDAGTVLAERILQSLMPQLNARMDSLEQRVADVRKDVAELREHTDQRFERMQELINELGLRINTVGSKLDVYVDITRSAQSDVKEFLQRPVRVEEAQKTRTRRAS